MGNAESQAQAAIDNFSVDRGTPRQEDSEVDVQIPARISIRPIVSESPVAGSPLAVFEQSSVDSSYLGFKGRKVPTDSLVGQFVVSKMQGEEYIQPPGERDYKNSSKIVHGFGPSGLAPLASLNNKKEKTIPIMVVWSQAGGVVQITGTFNQWQKKIRLRKSIEDFSTIIDMPPGVHQLKFIVDDEWKCSEDLPFAYDQEGNAVNEIEVVDEDGKSVLDGLEDIAEDEAKEVAATDSPITSYDCQMPPPPPLDLNANQEGPPLLPVHLQKVLLNSKAISDLDPYLLPVPNHVSLNHLYACSIRDGVMAIGSTHRYRNKAVDTVESTLDTLLEEEANRGKDSRAKLVQSNNVVNKETPKVESQTLQTRSNESAGLKMDPQPAVSVVESTVIPAESQISPNGEDELLNEEIDKELEAQGWADNDEDLQFSESVTPKEIATKEEQKQPQTTESKSEKQPRVETKNGSGSDNIKQLEMENLRLKQQVTDMMSKFGNMEAAHKSKVSELEKRLVEFTKSSQTYADSSMDDQLTRLTTKLAEKEACISGLLQEGENLAKDILRANNTIKKFRTDKEQITKELAEKTKKIEQLEAKVEKLEAANDTIRQLTERDHGNQKKISLLETALNKAQQEKSDMQGVAASLESQIKEIKEKFEQNSLQVQSEALEEQLALNSNLQSQLASAKQIANDLQNSLQSMTEQSQKTVADLQKHSSEREESLMKQIQDVEKKLFTAESKNQDIQYSSQEAMAPLIRQIAQLESQHQLAVTDWKSTETNLIQRCQLAEKGRHEIEVALQLVKKQLEESITAKETIRSNSDSHLNEISDLNDRIASLESQLNELRSQNQKLLKQNEELERLKQQNLSELTSSHNSSITAIKREYQEKIEKEIEMRKQMQMELNKSPTSSQISIEPPTLSEEKLNLPNAITNLNSQLKHYKAQIHALELQIKGLEANCSQKTQALVEVQEAKELLESKVAEGEQLKQQHQDLEKRYNTVLELLGEKEEKLLELQNDIEDIKIAYREYMNKQFQ